MVFFEKSDLVEHTIQSNKCISLRQPYPSVCSKSAFCVLPILSQTTFFKMYQRIGFLKKYLFVYLAALSFSCGMWSL